MTNAPVYLPLEGVLNARDVGGYQTDSGDVVRPSTLLRSAKLSSLTAADRSYLAGIGLHTVVDMRQDFEISADPDALGDLDVAWHNFPPTLDLLDGLDFASPGTTLLDLYLAWIDNCGWAFAAAIRELARPGALPALVHCTAGKDRTGLLIAMVLDLLGVGDEVILADYLESNVTLFDGPEPLANRRIYPEYLVGAIGHLRARYGSVAAYLAHHGVAEAELMALRAALLVEG